MSPRLAPPEPEPEGAADRTTAFYGQSSFHLLIPWDTTGRLEAFGVYTHERHYGTVDHPKRSGLVVGLLLKELLLNQ